MYKGSQCLLPRQKTIPGAHPARNIALTPLPERSVNPVKAARTNFPVRMADFFWYCAMF